MVGYENWQLTTFMDLLGRVFEWKFMPKEFPSFEISMQKAAQTRIDPLRPQLGRNVILKRDLFLVMCANEAK